VVGGTLEEVVVVGDTLEEVVVVGGALEEVVGVGVGVVEEEVEEVEEPDVESGVQSPSHVQVASLSP